MSPANPTQDFTHTVVCFSDGNARQKKCKIYAYRQPMRPVDYAAARLERDGRL